MTLKSFVPGKIFIALVCVLFVIPEGKTEAQKINDPCRFSNITLGAGINAFLDRTQTCSLIQLNYYAKKQFWIFSPFAGITVTSNNSYGIYAGVVIPFHLVKGLYLNCSFAPGLWDNPDVLDLGYPLEFRTGVELAYSIKNRIRLGIEFAHISNSNLGRENPGDETLSIVIGLPLMTGNAKRSVQKTTGVDR